MTDVPLLLAEIIRAGLNIEISGPNLEIEGPDDVIERFLPLIKAYKIEIIQYLESDPADRILDALNQYYTLIHRL